jgi:hypothetical protein
MSYIQDQQDFVGMIQLKEDSPVADPEPKGINPDQRLDLGVLARRVRCNLFDLGRDAVPQVARQALAALEGSGGVGDREHENCMPSGHIQCKSKMTISHALRLSRRSAPPWRTAETQP